MQADDLQKSERTVTETSLTVSGTAVWEVLWVLLVVAVVLT
ncbi:uncharacterized protein HHUB_3119 [Halobacterium hubeiense]|uniref:Uncharacterized protein n=1 Tax=Halobacterium hubeiense TaxID=1407499 RepID=A0A0U5AH53_9EURY|nr:uncharacterized protein HHUB_3119 [Halobacterium hubeiense]